MRNQITLRRATWAVVAGIATALAMGGCVIEFDPINDGGGGGDGGNGGVGDTTILIRVVNGTGATLDPEIYLTGAAVTDPEQLFTDERKFTVYGVGNRGLLGDFDTDSFTLECGEARVVGTKGGLFGDDLESPDGVGNRRILGQDTGFSCGDTITFTFTRSGDTFTTTVSVTR